MGVESYKPETRKRVGDNGEDIRKEQGTRERVQQAMNRSGEYKACLDEGMEEPNSSSKLGKEKREKDGRDRE